jgi:hypothetical protein
MEKLFSSGWLVWLRRRKKGEREEARKAKALWHVLSKGHHPTPHKRKKVLPLFRARKGKPQTKRVDELHHSNFSTF